MIIRIFSIAAALAIMPAAVHAQAVTPKTYVAKAGASDLYEKQSSQLVLASTKDAKVRQFANQMIAHHTKSTNDVKAAARQAGIAVPPPKLEPMQASNIAKLRAAKGTARDQAYIQQQKVAHQQALALHQGYAANGTAAPLKTAAAAIAPVVQTHIDELQQM